MESKLLPPIQLIDHTVYGRNALSPTKTGNDGDDDGDDNDYVACDNIVRLFKFMVQKYWCGARNELQPV